LNLWSTFINPTAALAVLKFQIQALLDMLKMNMSIHTIHLHGRYSQHEIFRESVIPYLETNWLWPRLLTIQRARPITYRAQVLGRALLSARTDANRFWMLLSGNAEVAFPSSTTTIEAAANFPTPGTAAAISTSTSTANVAATALTTTATDNLLAPAAETAAISAAAAPSPSAGQKRKARS
jgi:hypothetical protein